MITRLTDLMSKQRRQQVTSSKKCMTEITHMVSRMLWYAYSSIVSLISRRRGQANVC